MSLHTPQEYNAVYSYTNEQYSTQLIIIYIQENVIQEKKRSNPN